MFNQRQTPKKQIFNSSISFSYPPVVHLGVEAGPLVLQQGQVLLGLGGPGSRLLSSAGQDHGLSLIQQAVVQVGPVVQLGL